jgi:hypothetical protein
MSRFPHPLHKDLTMTRSLACTFLILALVACGGDFGPYGLDGAAPAAPAASAEDPGYFPSQFPAPQGDVERLPPQF